MGELLTGGLMFILSLLPDSPFVILDKLDGSGAITKILSYVNWFIPIYTFVGILEGWLACIAIYYVYQVILRWLRAIE